MLLLVDSPTDPLEHLTLDLPHKLDDNLVSDLFQICESTSTVEDHGVTEPVTLPAELDFIQQGVDGDLVVGRGDNLSSSKDGEALFEFWVQAPVWESSHCNSDSFEDSVAGELVHDQWSLHLSGLLVGVRHQAAHKVWLASVEGGHKLGERHKVDGGDRLSAALLLLLSLLLGCDRRLAYQFSIFKLLNKNESCQYHGEKKIKTYLGGPPKVVPAGNVFMS